MRKHIILIGGLAAIAVLITAGAHAGIVSPQDAALYTASFFAPNWYTVQYDKGVRHKLQSEGFLLRGTTSAPVDVKGNTLQFFVIGRGEAVEMSQTVEMVKPANLGKETFSVEMKDYQFNEFVRHGEPDRISVEFKSAIQEAGSMALGRKFDRIIMKSMDDEAGSIETVGDGTTPISPIDTSTAKAKINSLGMMKMNEFFCPLPSLAWEQMNLYKIFNNADYTGPEGLTFVKQADGKTWNKVNYFQLPDEAFTSPSAGQVYTYLWNKKTLGFGSNYAMRSVISYENLYTAWLYNSTMSGAGKVLDVQGVKRLHINIAAPLAIDGIAPEE